MSDQATTNEALHSGVSSVNVNVSYIDEETNRKLKGDAIGDTLYSQSFVLKTLLKFSNFEWSEQFEEDLCFLWDMTVEKDVCIYLCEISYPSIACSALINYNEPRFIEIVIGILANILCVYRTGQISDEEIGIVLKELDSDDHLILIQVLRYISSIAHKSTTVSFIDDERLCKIKFILNNSINTELLEKALETAAKITKENKISCELINIDLYEAVLSAFTTLFGHLSEFTLQDKDKFIACRYTLEVISNICSYIDKFENHELLLKMQTESNKYVDIILKILDYFRLEENLIPITTEIEFFFSVFRYTLITLNISFISKLFIALCKITLVLQQNQDEDSDTLDSIVELLCFIISKDYHGELINTIQKLSNSKVKIILKLVKENQHKYEYKFDIFGLMQEN